MIDPLIIRALMVALGLMLIGAAWHKASSFRKFVAVVADYRLLPNFLVPLAAALVPLAEIVLGAAWLAAMYTGFVAALTAAMFAVYSIAIAINLLRGRLHISCGCGLGAAGDENQPLSWILVLRNVLLSALSLLPILPASGRVLTLLDWIFLVAALAAAALLYLGGSQLLRNQAAIRSWRNQHA